MALDLPPELQPVLSLLGVEWPQVNEDEVVRLADELTRLASGIDSLQLAADKAVNTLRETYHGASADQFAELWGAISKFSGLVVEGCGTLVNVLHAGALVIQACKAASTAQLVATQGELAVASLTGPGGEAAVVAAGKQLVSAILDQAVSALGQALAKPVGDVVESVVKEVTGGGSIRSVGAGFGVDLSQLASCASKLRQHADDIETHGNSFRRLVESLDLGQSGDALGRVVIAAAEEIATAVGVEVIKRLLAAFQGTADRMDQVARNLTEHEEEHTRQLNGVLAGHSTPNPRSPLTLAGNVLGSPGAGRPHGNERLSLDGLSPSQDPAAPVAPAASASASPTPPQQPGSLTVHQPLGEPSVVRQHTHGPGTAQSSVTAQSRAPHAPGLVNPAAGRAPSPPAATSRVRAAVLEQHRNTLRRTAAPVDEAPDPELRGENRDPDS
ncbi:hypothetical protein ACFC1R_15460 [Kitasatospora sp. NPDC056138]|uniref:WXG100-like domain-containing protein n=1 Tax=Kitasatospora sp. NPDC056138 TaxID=3345724 RepID=UPI0035E36843